ncbi:MAG: hypothetical protein IJZ42_07185 [Lachnospiraceae bacterium]|nr:hypothetical protein [Lachnospiraceae bacterium]
MRLLQDGVREGYIIPTDVTRKLTMDGVTKVYQVYKIKLSCLYYNDQNDRIATWISKYKSDNDLEYFDMSDKEKYNGVIQQFIIDSNPSAIDKTKSNISMVDQREPGVVLNDGRIIDGNRRFTCLRLLSAKDEHFSWFEAVILDKDIHDNQKEIKMLELMIQHGEEGKVDYNPIDRLVGVYNDIIDKKLLTIAEYAKSTNEPEYEVKKRIELANLMVDFLEYINAPKQFYIARELELEGPLIELAAILKKCPDDETKQKMKISVFNNILVKPENDMTRFVRQIKSVIETEYLDDFIEEQIDLAEQVAEIIPEQITDAKTIQENVRQNEQIKEKLSHSMDKVVTKVKRTETRNKPAMMLDRSILSIESIDIHILEKLDKGELDIVRDKIEILKAHLMKIEDYVQNNYFNE